VLLATEIPLDKRVGDYKVEEGAMRLLLELQHQFQFVDRNADFGRYRLLIAPDSVCMDAELRAKVDVFIDAGGVLLVTGESGLSADAPTWERLGVTWECASPYDIEYLHLGDELADVAPPLDYAVYERAQRVAALPGTEVLAHIGEPYFNRTPFTYTSHQHAPIARILDAPAITRRGRAVYCAFPLFRAYKLHGNQIYKQVIERLVAGLLPDPLLKAAGPSTLEATVLEQQSGAERRWVAHLLHYIPQRRTPTLDIVEDVIPLHDLPVSVRTPSRPRRVYLAPQQTDLAFEWDGEYASAVLPRLDGHQLVCYVL
jgi:hypothetical protein